MSHPKDLNLLLTNDDGYTSKGLNALIELALPYGRVTVVAPKSMQSAMSNAVSIHKTLRMDKEVTPPEFPADRVSVYSCSGTPVDCVKMAMNVLFAEKKPDLLLSGINHGFNASTAVLYSGTLAAASEGVLYGVPSLALSLCSHRPDADFSACLHFAPAIINQFLASPPDNRTYINVNFPKGDVSQIRGIRLCRMGYGAWVKEMEPRIDPFGQPYYWVVGEYINLEPGNMECDHNLLNNKYITIVPHTVDNTHYAELERLKTAWTLLPPDNF